MHALLVCRLAEALDGGDITIHNVLEVIPVEALPGDVGPLTFLAMVRNLPQGPGQGAFVLRPDGNAEEQARLPMEIEVPAGLAGRQVALHVNVPSLPIRTGGWIELHFEWAGNVLATNRFAVGTRG